MREALGVDAVVATGGGVVTTPEGRDELRSAVTVWLDAADDVIVIPRLDDVERPLLGADPGAALATLRREREAPGTRTWRGPASTRGERPMRWPPR